MSELIVGIDLGTTNSSVAVFDGDAPRLIEVDGSPLLPSVVGLGIDGEILVGAAAFNQRHLFPERTVCSVKRHMGSDERFQLGETEYSPVELSALILRRLKLAAEADLGRPVRRAVITVPAYFSDAQRAATQQAGEVAGLEVVRILNEPTAAALCYTFDDGADRTIMVYDLGGGTFDVSIVRTRGGTTEVLASHGDTALGGDDFDTLLLEKLRASFEAATGLKVGDDLRAQARLRRAAEAAKRQLSSAQEVQITEEHLAMDGEVPRHLDVTVTRAEYEALIEPLLQRTRDSAQLATREAGVLSRDLDEVILVGGSTRTPRVSALLEDLVQIKPRCDVNPDEAVAMGAALHAARLAGDNRRQTLVDVTPFSFGASHLGEIDGRMSPHAFSVILRRNTVLPARRVLTLVTTQWGQEEVEACIYQGEHPDARKNIEIGRFLVEGLDSEADRHSPIDFELTLDVDGILHVRVIEQHTGLEKRVSIEDAFERLSPEALSEAQARVAADLDGMADEALLMRELPAAPADLPDPARAVWATAIALLEQAGGLGHAGLEPADARELDEFTDELKCAMEIPDLAAVERCSTELADVLFYLT